MCKKGVKSFRLNHGILIRRGKVFFFFFTRNAIKTRPCFGSTSFRHASVRDYKEAYLTTEG